METLDSDIYVLKQFINTHERDQLLMSRKLVLLVDLDQTLLHTSLENDLTDNDNIFRYELDQIKYQTRLRPHVDTFLRNVSELFDMRICTLATRGYACKMTSLLDKDGNYFGGRIISREDANSTSSKTSVLSNHFTVGDNLVVIIDDQRRVWSSAPNLIDVKPYVFFGQSNGNHIDDSDAYLNQLQSTLRNIHRDFFRAYDASVLQSQGSLPHVKSFMPNSLQPRVKRLRSCDQYMQQMSKRRCVDSVNYCCVGQVWSRSIETFTVLFNSVNYLI